jgi:hypothetical protein
MDNSVNEKVHRINDVLDEIIIDASELTRDLISTLGEYKSSAAFWFLLSFLFLVGSIQQSGYPQPDLWELIKSSAVIFSPAIYGFSRLWRYYSLKKKYSRLSEVLEEITKI